MKLENPSVAGDGSKDAKAGSGEHLTREDRALLFRYLLLMRLSEERGLTLYRQGKVPGSFYDGRGQEAIRVGATYALAAADAVCSPLIRDLGAHLVRGTDVTDIFRQPNR